MADVKIGVTDLLLLIELYLEDRSDHIDRAGATRRLRVAGFVSDGCRITNAGRDSVETLCYGRPLTERHHAEMPMLDPKRDGQCDTGCGRLGKERKIAGQRIGEYCDTCWHNMTRPQEGR